jgi:hypothetical protein
MPLPLAAIAWLGRLVLSEPVHVSVFDASTCAGPCPGCTTAAAFIAAGAGCAAAHTALRSSLEQCFFFSGDGLIAENREDDALACYLRASEVEPSDKVHATDERHLAQTRPGSCGTIRAHHRYRFVPVREDEATRCRMVGSNCSTC